MYFKDEIEIAVDSFLNSHNILGGYPNTPHKSSDKGLKIYLDGVLVTHEELKNRIYIEYDKSVGFNKNRSGVQGKLKKVMLDRIKSKIRS